MSVWSSGTVDDPGIGSWLPIGTIFFVVGLLLAATAGCGKPSRDMAGSESSAIGPAPAAVGVAPADEPRGGERSSPARTARPLPESFAALRDETLALAADLRRRHADAPETIDLEAAMHDRFGHLAAATALWESWLATHPDSPEAHFRLGKYAKERGDDSAAIDHLEISFSTKPELPGAQVLLGELLTGVGRAGDAVAVLSRELPATAGNPNRLILLGHAHLQSGDFAAAKASFERALAIAPSSPHALFGLGTACARLGDAEGARRHLAEFAARKEEALAKDRANAAARLDDMPALRATAAGWYAIAGRIDAARGDMTSAERAWLRAVDFSPAHRDAVTGLVDILRRQGRDEDARAIVERARGAGGAD